MRGTVKHTISLDLSRGGIQARIPVRQGDALIHDITIALKNKGASYKPDGAELAQIYALLPSGDTVSCDGKISSDGKVSFIPGGGFFTCGGPVICRLSIRGRDGGEFYSPAFAIDTDPCFAADAPTVPAEEYSRMEELLLKVLEIKKNCEDIAGDILANKALPFDNASPMPDGTSSAGTSELASRSDHVHPTDTSRMPAMQNMESSTAVSSSDVFPFYSQTDKEMKKVLWGRMAVLLKQAIAPGIDQIGNMKYVGTALSITAITEDSTISPIFVEPGEQVIPVSGTVADYRGIAYLYTGSKWVSITGNVPDTQAITITGVDENGNSYSWTVHGVSV